MLRRELVVEALELHRDEPTEVRNHVLHVRESRGHAAHDQVQHHDAVFDRRASRGAETVVGDERRAQASKGRVIEEHAVASIELGIDRLELDFGRRAIHDRERHGRPDEPELIQAALELAQRGVDVRQRQGDVGRESVGVAVRQFGKGVVAQPRRFDGIGLVGKIGIARRGAEHLHPHARLLHELQACRDLIGRVGRRIGKARLRPPAQPRDQLGIPLGVVVAVDVDHGFNLSSSSALSHSILRRAAGARSSASSSACT